MIDLAEFVSDYLAMDEEAGVPDPHDIAEAYADLVYDERAPMSDVELNLWIHQLTEQVAYYLPEARLQR